MAMVVSTPILPSVVFAVAIIGVVNADVTSYGDRFNYDETVTRPDGWVDYAPEDWAQISCDESSREGLDECIAYRDKWHQGQDWQIEDNYCQWCPEGADGSCGQHRQSPINLERNRGLGYWGSTAENNGDPGEGADAKASECIDIHWMKYEDSWCPLDQLVAANAFTIERHALRISQPITTDENDDVSIDCFIEGKGRRFGRLDYSRGFSEWWYLSHIDIHTPSEHTQDGKRYDAELQLHHWYSVGYSETGVNNELGTVSIFLQAYDNVPPYAYLDEVICQWRRTEYETRTACGLDPIEETYPGCFPYNSATTGGNKRQRRTSEKKQPYKTVQDFLVHRDTMRWKGVDNDTIPNLIMDPENWGPAEKTDEEWAEFIEHHSGEHEEEERIWKEVHRQFNDTYQAHEVFHERLRGRRRLLMGDELEWFNYFPMLGVRTEYYFRYSGTMTTPPCYGKFFVTSREGAVNWRVMKDPIRIHPRQLKEMKRLLANRIQPIDGDVMACQPDTAAKVDGDDVDTARPLQYWYSSHQEVFCECKDWASKWPEDRKWCRIDDIYERFYETPYNFDTDGF
eukprot:Nitzschia sp. Nitz4//scaffold115_size69933//22785//24554//NITZ4_005998-RA/size69933-processed-gene-0.55-mRNA-1//1//CDS//3329533487//841//frame0